MSDEITAGGEESLPRVMRREVFGHRTLFDWFFVTFALSGTAVATLYLAKLNSTMENLQRDVGNARADSVSHLQLMRWSYGFPPELKVRPYIPPETSRTDGENR